MGSKFQSEDNPNHPDNGKIVSHIEKYSVWDKERQDHVQKRECDNITRPSTFVCMRQSH